MRSSWSPWFCIRELLTTAHVCVQDWWDDLWFQLFKLRDSIHTSTDRVGEVLALFETLWLRTLLVASRITGITILNPQRVLKVRAFSIGIEVWNHQISKGGAGLGAEGTRRHVPDSCQFSSDFSRVFSTFKTTHWNPPLKKYYSSERRSQLLCQRSVLKMLKIHRYRVWRQRCLIEAEQRPFSSRHHRSETDSCSV